MNQPDMFGVRKAAREQRSREIQRREVEKMRQILKIKKAKS